MIPALRPRPRQALEPAQPAALVPSASPWIVALALLLPLAAAARAQDPAQQGLELSLESALGLAEVNNLGLRMQDVATEVAYLNAGGSWGAFDWLFSTTVSATDAKREAESAFQASKEKSQRASVDLTRPLQAGGEFGFSWSSARNETDNPFFPFPLYYSDSFRLSFSQPLLRGYGRKVATSEQREAEVEYQKQLEGQRQSRHELLLAVSDAYWDLVMVRRQLEVSRSSLRLAEEQLQRDRRVFEAGLGTEVNVIQAEAQVATRNEALLAGELAVRQAGDALKQLLFPGTDEASWNTELIPTTPFRVDLVVTEQSWPQALRTALEFRPDLRQSRLEIEAAELRHERAVSNRRAALDLGLSATSAGFGTDFDEAFGDGATYEFPTYSASLTYSVPIGNRSARNAERAARALARSAHLAYDQAESLAVGEVREALRQLAHQARAIEAAETSVEASRRQLEAEEARQREGISTNFEVLQFQDQYVQALNTEVSARVSYMKAKTQLLAAQGLLDPEGAPPVAPPRDLRSGTGE